MIDLLGKSYLSPKEPAFYDLIAKSHQELLGNMYAKVNETVTDQNALREETEEHLQEQDVNIAERLDSQDANITDIRSVVVPNDVKNEFQKNVHNGTFDNMINTYAGDLSERVDHLLGSVTQGSTTMDAEIIDLRMGEDNTIYDNAGVAVRTQMKELKDLFRIRPIEWFDNSYVKITDGKQTSISVNYCCTGYIEIPKGLKNILLKCKTSDDSSGICFYDANKVFISGVNTLNNSTLKETSVAIPEKTAFIRFSSRMDAKEESYITLTDNIGQLLVETIGEEVDKLSLELEITWGQYLTATGKINNFAGNPQCGTCEIPVKYGQQFTISSSARDASKVYVLMDASGKSIEAFPAEYPTEDTSYDVTITIPNNCVSMKLGTWLGTLVVYEEINGSALVEKLDEIDKAVKNLKTPTTLYSYAVSNVLCIGDSLTAGAYYVNGGTGSAISKTYPYYLSRMLNCNVQNAGRSGYSASDWWKTYGGFYEYSSYDSFIIWLGTNYGCGTMPTDEEIENFTPDLEASADSVEQALYLIHIIKAIQSANPEAPIFLGNVFASKAGVDVNNNVVSQIAEKYGCCLVDMSDLGSGTHPELHGYIGNPHFSKAGNIFIADRIKNAIHTYMSEDLNRVEFGL